MKLKIMKYVKMAIFIEICFISISSFIFDEGFYDNFLSKLIVKLY